MQGQRISITPPSVRLHRNDIRRSFCRHRQPSPLPLTSFILQVLTKSYSEIEKPSDQRTEELIHNPRLLSCNSNIEIL
ncbi:hypothetical protein LINPERHAP2_LOCUS23115 [Linum perenne]